MENFGKYRLIERVAVGGMAEIYKAKTAGLSGFERVVAIKRLHNHLNQDQELAQMLVDEAKIAVQLNHPNIGQVFDLGQVNGQYFMVMEFIDGPDLHRVLRRLREQQLYCPLPLALHIIAETCGALDFAHNIIGHDGHPLQLVHRDVSPQNIMLTTSGEVKLVDFGIAKARHRMMETQAGIIKGKFYYMAPEQAYGHKLDARTDIFAIGMVLYESLVGRSAYEDTDDMSLLKRARTADFPPPSAYRPDIDPALEAIVMRALHREPQRRYQTARELQAALRQHISQRLGEVDRYQVAQLVQQIVGPTTPPSASGRLPAMVAPQQVMERRDYQVSEDSLLYRGPIPESTEPTHSTHFDEGMLQDSTGFEDDGPTYVYSRDEDNPFAVPDLLHDPFGGAKSAPEPAPSPGPVSGPIMPGYQPMSYASTDRTLPAGYPMQPAQGQQPALRSPDMALPSHYQAPARFAAANITRRLNLAAIPPKARIAAGAALAVVFGSMILAIALGGGDDKAEANAAIKPEVAAITRPEPPPAVDKYLDVPIISTPSNAQVFLDGSLVGTTPMSLPQLEIGRTYGLKVVAKGRTWEDEVVVRADHDPLTVDFSKVKSVAGVLKIVTHPPGLRIEVDGKDVGTSPAEVVDLSRDEDHTVVAALEDGTMRRQVVSWLEDEPEIKNVEITFNLDTANVNALPKPPETIKSTPKNNRKPPVRNQKPPKEEKEDDSLNIWGDKKAEPKKAEPKKTEAKKKPAKKDDEEPLVNW